MIFTLDERLEADTVHISDMDLCQIRMMKDANYPWVVMVPRVPDVREIHDLSDSDQSRLMTELANVSAVLEKAFQADKMNVGALGNIVPQLHVHVVARFHEDPAWPDPVWGKHPPAAYPDGDLEVWTEGLKKILA